MQKAESQSRKNRKAGPGTDKLANAAKLGALERNLGVPVKRHRDPGKPSLSPFEKDSTEIKQDETVIVERGF